METPSLKHWGIWIGDSQSWMRFDSANIFWTTSREVAEAQLAASDLAGDAAVREFAPITVCEASGMQ